MRKRRSFTRTAWTVQDIALVIRDRNIGRSASQTAKKVERTAAAVANLRSQYNVYKFNGKTDSLSTAMRGMFDTVIAKDPMDLDALIKTEEEVISTDPVVAIDEPEQQEEIDTDEEDGLYKVDEAFTKFQNAVVEFIDTESRKQAAEKVKALEVQYKEKLQNCEKELARLEEILSHAKDSSLIGLLQKKLRG